MFKKTEGTIQNLAGKAQDAIGDATGDAGMQVEGKARQVAGKAQQTYGEALDQVRDATTNHPVTTLAVVSAVSFFLGAIWSKR